MSFAIGVSETIAFSPWQLLSRFISSFRLWFNRTSPTLNRLGILIDILQVPPSLGNTINRRLLRDNFAIRVLSDVGKFSPSVEVFGVSLVALFISQNMIRDVHRIWGVSVTHVCLFGEVPVAATEGHVGCDSLLGEIDDDGYHGPRLFHPRDLEAWP
jgi:hypothetical protein